MADHTEPGGVGGWLAALIVILGVIAPLFYVYIIWFALDAQARLARIGAEAMPFWGQLTALWMLSLAKMVIALVIAGTLLRFRTRMALHVAIAGIWVLSVGVIIPDVLLFGGGFGTPLRRVAMLFGVGLAFAIPPTLYLLRSKRVANTYRPPATGDAFAAIFE